MQQCDEETKTKDEQTQVQEVEEENEVSQEIPREVMPWTLLFLCVYQQLMSYNTVWLLNFL